MSVLIGIVGKPNVGKSTFFAAVTMMDVPIASYPFTTIKPNRGVGYVRVPCACKDFGVKCNPRNSICIDGMRYAPVELLDVAGLVPGAHEGKGLGNKFLDDLRQANALIHVVDASGMTNEQGEICGKKCHNPKDDVEWLIEEIDYWIYGIIQKDWKRVSRRVEAEKIPLERILYEKLSGLRITEEQLAEAVRNVGKDPEKPTSWNEKDVFLLASEIRKISKPMIIAANKADMADEDFLKELMSLKDIKVIPTSSEAELALRKASRAGLIYYRPGDPDFKVLKPNDLTEKQKHVLEKIRELVLDRFGSTGVQQVLDTVAFDILNLVPVFPVEDENKLTDTEGNVLPDVYLMPKGSTALDLAYKIHTELGDSFIRAVEVRTKKIVGADYILKPRDVIKIVTGKKH
ncbi:MAG: redox-regulated ATPase YchF [Euryarchaeota archaeon]|nr:redox-regulated ATPase YchF [Euryarchaeota archaeon]